MRGCAWLALVVGCACAIETSSHRPMLAAVIDRVELDVVAVDDRGGPVEGLRPDDFDIRDDDTSVTVNSVAEVGSADIAAPRVVVLVLDDRSIPPELTTRVQRIATLFVNRAAPGDRVNVVRFSHRTDEAVGNPAAARARIADYRSGIVPFFGRETLENALEQVVKLSRHSSRSSLAGARSSQSVRQAPSTLGNQSTGVAVYCGVTGSMRLARPRARTSTCRSSTRLALPDGSRS
jgi:hypothetical protein